MIGRRTLLWALLLAAPALAGDEIAPKLTLKTAKPTYAYGELPALSLAFENPTATPLQVVMPCDGSQHGLRTPSYTWTLERVDGDPIQRQVLGLCGTVNPLTPSDFQTVAPDTALPVPVGQGWLGLPGDATTWLEPGRYRVRMTYTWDPAKIALARQQEGVAEKVQACGKLELASAPVEFEVAAPSPAQRVRVSAWRDLPAEASEAQVREALGEPDAVRPWGKGQAWSYAVGPDLSLTVVVLEGAVASTRAEYQR